MVSEYKRGQQYQLGLGPKEKVVPSMEHWHHDRFNEYWWIHYGETVTGRVWDEHIDGPHAYSWGVWRRNPIDGSESMVNSGWAATLREAQQRVLEIAKQEYRNVI